MIIRWEIIPGHREPVTYIVNEIIIGDGDHGFNKIIKIIKEDRQLERVTLKVNNISGLAGESFDKAFPFGPRYYELKNALGKRTLLIDYL